MKAVWDALCLVVLAIGTLNAQTTQDEAALRALPQAFSAAFNTHDGHALAAIMAEDVDFVTVGLTWLHGRADFEKYHTRLLVGRFKEISHTVLETHVRFVGPDVAVVRHSWTAQGDKNVDGSARPQRFGLMTMVAERRNEMWLVAAVQNTRADGSDPVAHARGAGHQVANGRAAAQVAESGRPVSMVEGCAAPKRNPDRSLPDGVGLSISSCAKKDPS